MDFAGLMCNKNTFVLCDKPDSRTMLKPNPLILKLYSFFFYTQLVKIDVHGTAHRDIFL